MYKTFILTFDGVEMNNVIVQLYAFVQSNALTYQFSSPYLGTIFIKSNSDLTTLSYSYNSFFNGRHFLLAEIDPDQTAGRQLANVWNWLNNPAPLPLPYTPLGPA